MKTATLTLSFNLKCLDARIASPFSLNKKKIMIGSHEQCDFKIQDKSVSSYHAFILVKDEGFMVKDLYSEAGVFVNGKRVEEAFISQGDVLTIGTLNFSVEGLEQAVEIFNADANITQIAQAPQSVELPSREGLVFIDGDYCDIKFDESNFAPLSSMPVMSFKGEYIDLEQTDEIMKIAHSVKDKRLEIISYMNGLMMDVSYLAMKDGDYHFDSKKKKASDILFHTVGRLKVFSIQNGHLSFHPSDLLNPSMPWDRISMEESLFFSHGAEQISLRLVDRSTTWNGIPMFHRDRDQLKQSAKVFASFFLPIMLLLFITIPKPDELKEDVAIIYKVVPVQKTAEAQEKSDVKAEELTSKTENTGHKDTQQPNQKVEFAAASQQQKVVAKAQAPAPADAAPTPVAAVKAYEFKTSVALNSLVGEAPAVNTKGSASNSAVTDSTFNTGTSDDGQLVAGADIGVSKFNGSDKKGSGSGSYGSRGLASKSGFDSSYLEPKTVVLGSMDPELLRKILREYIPQFRHCYQQELIGNSDKIKGIIDLNFTISAGGKVSKYDIRMKDAKFSQKGAGCMGQVLGLIDFPKPKGGGVVDVRQPLNFFAETEKI